MADLHGVDIEKLQGGMGRIAAGTDSHVAFVLVGLPAGAVKTAVLNSGKGVVITSVFEAEAIGINEAYDANNNLRYYDQIVEFFRLAPEATLYLYASDVIADIKTFLNHNPEIKGYGVNGTYNTVTPNLTTVMSAHQVMINELAAVNRLIDFAFIGMNGLNDFTVDLFTRNAPQISVFANCDENDGFVCLGSSLGMQAVRMVNENLGSVNIRKKPLAKRGTIDYSLTDILLERWLESYLPNGTSVSSMDNAALAAIIAKGYIVVAQYQGYAGFFFENSYTAIERSSDFAQIENNRTWNKAARIVRVTLLPEVKGVVKKDPTTGYIATTTVKRWKTLLDKALGQMVIDDEISGFETYIDNRQVVNSTAPVNVKVSIVADGIVHEFLVAVGLTNSI